MVAELGYPPPGVSSGDFGVRRGLTEHHHMGDGAEDGVMLRSVPDKLVTVMGIMQGMVAMMTKIYHGSGVAAKGGHSGNVRRKGAESDLSKGRGTGKPESAG